MMESKRCAACGQAFRPRPQVPQQCYCPAPACQRERRRSWQLAKRQSDPDYHDNQARAQRAWRKRNPDYWREYRRTHPQYRDRNRAQQRERNDRRRERLIAKMDVSMVEQTNGQDVLNLVLARGYLAKLLENKQVVRYLKQRQPEVLAEFETIVQTVSLEQ